MEGANGNREGHMQESFKLMRFRESLDLRGQNKLLFNSSHEWCYSSIIGNFLLIFVSSL